MEWPLAALDTRASESRSAVERIACRAPLPSGSWPTGSIKTTVISTAGALICRPSSEPSGRGQQRGVGARAIERQQKSQQVFLLIAREGGARDLARAGEAEGVAAVAEELDR